jgi:hypothetical protein
MNCSQGRFIGPYARLRLVKRTPTMPRTRSVKPVSCRPRGVPRSGNGSGGWAWVFVDGFWCEEPLMGVGVRAAVVFPGVGVRTAVRCWSVEAAFSAVAVAALGVDVIAGRAAGLKLPDDVEGAAVVKEAPLLCGSVGRIPDSRKASPITAAIVLTARNERCGQDRRRTGGFVVAGCSPWSWP